MMRSLLYMNDDNVIRLHDDDDEVNTENAMQKHFSNHGDSGKIVTNNKKIYKDPVILGVMGVATIVTSFIIYSKFSHSNNPMPFASAQTVPFTPYTPQPPQQPSQFAQSTNNMQAQANGVSIGISQNEQKDVSSGISVAVNDTQEVIPGVNVASGSTSVSVQNSANSALSVSITQQPQQETSQVTAAAPKPSATVPVAPVTTSVSSTTSQLLANKPSHEPAKVTAIHDHENAKQTKTASNTVHPTDNKAVVMNGPRNVSTKQANTDLLVGNFTVVRYETQKTDNTTKTTQSNLSPQDKPFTIYAIRDDKVWLRNKQSGEVIIAEKNETIPVIGKIISIDQENGVVKATNMIIDK